MQCDNPAPTGIYGGESMGSDHMELIESPLPLLVEGFC